jgi:hypothetical protein
MLSASPDHPPEPTKEGKQMRYDARGNGRFAPNTAAFVSPLVLRTRPPLVGNKLGNKLGKHFGTKARSFWLPSGACTRAVCTSFGIVSEGV